MFKILFSNIRPAMEFADLYDDILFLIFDELILSFEKNIIKILDSHIEHMGNWKSRINDYFKEYMVKKIYKEIIAARADGFILSCRNNYSAYQRYKLRSINDNTKIFKYYSIKNIKYQSELIVFITEFPAAIILSKQLKQSMDFDIIKISKEITQYGYNFNLSYSSKDGYLDRKIIDKKDDYSKYKINIIIPSIAIQSFNEIMVNYDLYISYKLLFDYSKQIRIEKNSDWYQHEYDCLPMFTITINGNLTSIKNKLNIIFIKKFINNYELMRPKSVNLLMKFLKKEMKNYYDFFKDIEEIYEKMKIIIGKYGGNEYIKKKEFNEIFNEEFNKKI